MAKPATPSETVPHDGAQPHASPAQVHLYRDGQTRRIITAMPILADDPLLHRQP
jgi:hypothetical protein